MVSTVKRTDQYLSTPAPRETSPQMRDWLKDEFERVELSVSALTQSIDAIRSAPRITMAGDADDFNLDTIDSKLVNYTLGGSIGEVPVGPDLVAGNITLPVQGAYKMTAYVYGLQPSVVQNQTIRLLLDVNGIKEIVATLDVASVLTEDRTLLATFSRVFQVDDVISMFMNATADMGTFEVQNTSLEMDFVVLADGTPESLVLNFP